MASARADILVVLTDLDVPAGSTPTLPFPLSDGLALVALDPDELSTIKMACYPPGLPAVRPADVTSCPYTFVRSAPPTGDPGELVWDRDQFLRLAIAISQLVRPTSVSSEFSAQIERVDGRLVRVTHSRRCAQTYVTDTDSPPWFTQAEAAALQDLLSSYWSLAPEMRSAGSRLGNALWFHAGLCQSYYVEIRLMYAVTALEALINTSTQQATKQFTTRLPLVAEEVDEEVTKTQASKIYDARSKAAHGSPTVLGAEVAKRKKSLDQLELTERILRKLLLRGFAEKEFQAVFSSSDEVDKRWRV